MDPLTINGAEVIKPDIVAQEVGVVHLIDTILIPERDDDDLASSACEEKCNKSFKAMEKCFVDAQPDEILGNLLECSMCYSDIASSFLGSLGEMLPPDMDAVANLDVLNLDKLNLDLPGLTEKCEGACGTCYAHMEEGTQCLVSCEAQNSDKILGNPAPQDDEEEGSNSDSFDDNVAEAKCKDGSECARRCKDDFESARDCFWTMEDEQAGETCVGCIFLKDKVSLLDAGDITAGEYVEKICLNAPECLGACGVCYQTIRLASKCAWDCDTEKHETDSTAPVIPDDSGEDINALKEARCEQGSDCIKRCEDTMSAHEQCFANKDANQPGDKDACKNCAEAKDQIELLSSGGISVDNYVEQQCVRAHRVCGCLWRLLRVYGERF